MGCFQVMKVNRNTNQRLDSQISPQLDILAHQNREANLHQGRNYRCQD